MTEGIYHGGRLDHARREFGEGDWLDLSTGINPNAYPIGHISADAWQRLPSDRSMGELLDVARKAYGVKAESAVVAANGTQALIELLPKLLGCKHVAIHGPTYGEHAHSWQRAGAQIIQLVAGDPVPVAADCVVVVNPNNPDGRIMAVAEMLAIAGELEKRRGYLIVDEAFCDAWPEASVVGQMPPNCIVLKSFGKFYGLAGVRLGFAIATSDLCRIADTRMGPWAVSGPALEIGSKALADRQWASEMAGQLKQQSETEQAGLAKAGLEVIGCNPLFIYCRHQDAGRIYLELCRRHILVRPFADMPDRLRIGLCRTDTQLERLVGALSDLIGKT
jgi:cobalamin biosynthetic protein CobC